MQRGKWEQQQTLCSSQSGAPVVARVTSVFLKGNVITSLINKKSDRTICHKPASTAAVVAILSLGCSMGSWGKACLVTHHTGCAATGPNEWAEGLAGSIEFPTMGCKRHQDTKHGRGGAGCCRGLLTFNPQTTVAYASRLNCRCSSLLCRSGQQAADLMVEEAGLGEKLMKTLSCGMQLKWPGSMSMGGSLGCCSCSASSNG